MKTNYSGVVLIWLVTALILTACGGGGATNSNQTSNTAPIANAGTAQNVTTGTLVTLNGSASSDANGDPLTYSWTLTSKPAGSTATLTGATSAAPTLTADLAGTYVASLVVNDGQVNSNVLLGIASTVTITATVANAGTYFIGGSVSGLTGTGLVLSNNGGDNLTVTTNGAGSFTNKLATGASYSVTVMTQPTGQTCTVINGNGTVNNADVADIGISCSSNATPLICVAGNGTGYQGVSLYTPNNIVSYSLSTTGANARNIVTLNWGAAYTGTTQGAYTGSLKAQLWAVSSSYTGAGATIYGNILGTFDPNFSGVGAFSTSQIVSGGYSINTITSSATSFNPSSGQYCLVITLSEYIPGGCSPNQNGYCMVDWKQFGNPVTFY